MQCATVNRPKGFLGRLLGGSKASRLTFFNIIALFFVLIFYSFMAAGVPDGTWKQSGYKFSLSAFSHANQVFTSVRVTKEKSGEWTGGAPEIVLESGALTEAFTPALPSAKGETAYIRTVFPMPESRKISCEIRFGDKTQRLTVEVKEE